MAQNVITTDQVNYQRMIATKLEDTYKMWMERFAWYPVEQEQHYRRYEEIYKESRQMYGDKHWRGYAQRNRLHKRFTDDNEEVKKVREELKGPINKELMLYDGCKGCEVSLTTNGEYGRVKPSKIHYC